ncbi:hypothetical protein NLU13_0374 [Sarocladium strictum]|uniref:DUF7728 domain-containing protein n=1 Tax=Sarocladium strictum TaxID=5046 RepID=A0AA39LAR6_SARSR|nr:hypothetical protein NLU13_0374 [Sarocladium strictum]
MRSSLLALAAPAAAFLVMPEMAPAANPEQSEGAFKALPIEDLGPFALPPSVQSQTVHVPCNECRGKDASLRFDINVHDNSKLMVNNFEVYPADEPVGDLLALVTESNGVTEEEELSWVIWWQVVDQDKAQGMYVVDFHLGVGSVGASPVSDVSLAMSLIIGPNGEILIADVQTNGPSEPSEPARRPMHHRPACDGLLCEVGQFWGNLFKGGMGCHRHHGETVAHPSHSERPHEASGHVRHGHRFGKMVKNVAAHILLPVVMGITAGVGAAVLVMFLCSIVAFVVRRLAGREAQYSWTLIPSEVVLIEEDVNEVDEKNGLMNGQAPPPAYAECSEKE